MPKYFVQLSSVTAGVHKLPTDFCYTRRSVATEGTDDTLVSDLLKRATSFAHANKLHTHTLPLKLMFIANFIYDIDNGIILKNRFSEFNQLPQGLTVKNMRRIPEIDPQLLVKAGITIKF